MKRKITRNIRSKLLKSSLALALAASMIPFSFSPGVANAEAAGNTATLRILETTDLHNNIMSYDYYQDTSAGINYGLSKTASLIGQARSEVPTENSMLFDAGDTLQGNPMADYVAKVKPITKADTHPMFKAMNLLKYDAAIVGNHEFNFGLDFLDTALANAAFPIVNANIYIDDKDGNPDNDKNYFTPYEIIDKKIKDKNGQEQTVKVGVIGLAPPQIMQWDRDKVEGKLIIKDIVKTANKFIPEMKAKGADVIVAIAHSGCDIASEGKEAAENAVFDLTKVDGIDAMLFGHSHTNFPGSSFNGKKGIDNEKGHINNTPAVEAGYWGNNLGVLDLELVQQADGTWKADRANSKSVNRPVTAATNAVDEIVNAVKHEHEATLDYVRGKLGETPAPINTFFSRVIDDPALQLINEAQADFVKKYITEHRPDLKDIPVISAAAPFKGGSSYTNIPKGDISIKSANDLYIYNNTLKALQLTGAEVKEWLELCAAAFNKIDPNKDGIQDLLDNGFTPYNYDVIDGLKYQIDVTKNARYTRNGVRTSSQEHRIIHLTMMDGTPVKDDQVFILATNNHRAGGTGNYPGTGADAKLILDSLLENREVLMDYIKEKNVVNAVADNNWKIAPVGGVAKLVFNSSPDAKAYLSSAPNLKDLGPSTIRPGYQLYELDQNVHVKLLGINDLHGQLDYSTTVSGQLVGGIEYLAGYLKEKEATNPSHTLKVHAGDAVGASRPVSALMQEEPTIRFLNELGFDVGTVGNHEFDQGITEMMRLINGGSHPKTVDKYGPFEGASFPYTVANVVDEKTNELILPPYVIKEVDGVKIGFIGVVTTETPTIVTPSGVAGVKFTDEVDAINKYTAVLKEKGIKAIVVLAHESGSSSTNGSNPTGKVVEFAKKVDDEVDVIFGAHNHAYMNSTVNGKLMIQSYSYGTAFSDVDLTIDPVTQDIVAKEAKIVRTVQNKEHLDSKTKAKLDEYLEYIQPITSEVVGEAATAISRSTSSAGESALGNLIADGMRANTGTQFAFMNSGGIRDDIKKPGPITWGDLFAIQPFGNDIVTMKITGDQVRILLNQQWSDSGSKVMQISGLKYTWTSKLPIGNRVLDIYLPDGTEIDPKGEYTVTVNNFMADGGDGFTILKEGKERVTGTTDFKAFFNYVKAQSVIKPIAPVIEGRILRDVVKTPTVQVSQFDSILRGQTSPGAKIVVSIGEIKFDEVTADASGKFEVEIGKQAVGTVITLDITDTLGNKGTFKVTVAAPAAPVVNPVTDADVVITGTSEAGEKVVAKAGDKELGTAVANAEGKFTITIAKQAAGTVIMVTATDAAGNVSIATEVTVSDATAPAAPQVNDVTDADEILTGTAEAGSTVTAMVDGKEIGQATADSAGKFEIKIAKLAAGVKISVTATDAAGNTSAATEVTVSAKVVEQPAKQGWKFENGKWYFYDNDLAKTGWLKDKEKWYYLGADGAMVTKAWVQTGAKWYYLGTDGVMVTKAWAQTGAKWYYLGADGVMVTKAWVQTGAKWYYLSADGAMVTKSWAQSGAKWYYLDADGVMVTKAWVLSGGKWYFLGSDGKMLENEWLLDKNKWYYLGKNGAMASTSWVLSGSNWYFMDNHGAMKTGWVLTGGKWYYLYTNGKMAANTVVQGYKLGANGAWIK
ncbi:bifunctional 2',3'-cyclic-nucleotide 2'-phosphodiesterase/3'-nucleotidase [Neobacillus novalis]|uniref:Bifunctional 2',3'-cyclic-nucleotide 2'-phosphodiesterase/3'-nucleotidase n=1 Tax=Neobacillus novalis TaxID=220687 RepID=A0AA95MLH7_9BACI|nr:bifunctional 2',3'-cyclic-nucleotide 2'-phosphodiesterase/3'-nucleotidase [Neobacillus novalis]WHY85715.1 bifunctional 2',3'-cyclic-nucleotide 2'-phosphodiesterase/3'-nucleotidase [Neobacillus novalis]